MSEVEVSLLTVKQEILIKERKIGREFPPYVVAELSGNHGGDYGRAVEMLRVASECGVDAIKLQTFRADSMTLDCDGEDFQPASELWRGKRNLYSLYEEAATPWEWHAGLFEEARALGVTIFSSPFCLDSVAFLEGLGCPAYKIASHEVSDIELLKAVGRTGKPVIFSTGVSTLEDIDLAVETLRGVGCEQLIILKCTTAYPTPYSEVNLRMIDSLEERYGCLVGLSDHTLGVAVPIASVVMGATFIEKHFILSREEGGVDSAFSLNPEEFRSLVVEVRNAYDALGDKEYALTEKAIQSREKRRSLYVSADIGKGELFTEKNLRTIRPGKGLHPKHFTEVLGKRALLDLKKGEALSWEVVG